MLLTQLMPMAKKPDRTDAREFALSKMPMRNALSEGLYQKEKQSIQQGTIKIPWLVDIVKQVCIETLTNSSLGDTEKESGGNQTGRIGASRDGHDNDAPYSLLSSKLSDLIGKVLAYR